MKRGESVADEGAKAGPTLTVTFHVTHNCNLRCVYCYVGEKSAVRQYIQWARSQGVQ